MNLAAFRSRIQSTLGVAAGTAGGEQTLVDGWVNEGIVQFLMRTKAVKRTAVLALTQDVGDYIIDPNILSLEDLYISGAMLPVVDTADIRRWRLAQSGTPVGTTGYSYAYEGQTLMLYPTPGANPDPLHIVYVQRPTVLSTPTDDPAVSPWGSIPAEYHPVIEAYAKWKTAEYANDAPSQNGQLFKQEYEAGIVASRIIETRKAGVNIRRARPGSRTAQGVGVSPGVDQGT